jgi:hypothetical protein
VIEYKCNIGGYMREVKINQIYRHFKGRYVYIKDIVLDSETKEKCVVYIHLDDNSTWVRKLSMFLEEIDANRSDNITNQKYRFELVMLDKEGIK